VAWRSSSIVVAGGVLPASQAYFWLALERQPVWLSPGRWVSRGGWGGGTLLWPPARGRLPVGCWGALWGVGGLPAVPVARKDRKRNPGWLPPRRLCHAPRRGRVGAWEILGRVRIALVVRFSRIVAVTGLRVAMIPGLRADLFGRLLSAAHVCPASGLSLTTAVLSHVSQARDQHATSGYKDLTNFMYSVPRLSTGFKEMIVSISVCGQEWR